MKLTKPTVDGLKPTASEACYWDDEVPGFGVRVLPTGRKTYVVRYRLEDGAQRKMKIGRCCDFTPDAARQEARKRFAEVATGADPAQARRESRVAPTLLELRERYMAEHAKPFKKVRSVELDESNWRLHILPTLGEATRVRALGEEHMLKIKGTLCAKPAIANQCLALLSKALNLAEVWKWRPTNTNPCKLVKKYKLKTRDTILTLDQVRTLHTTMLEMETDGELTREAGDLVRLLLLTGCRLREIMHARREWVDLERGLLLLPDSKVGQRTINLPAAALEVIQDGPAGAAWLVPGKVPGKPLQSPYRAWARIKARAGLPAKLSPHGLRHTIGTLADKSGMSQKEIAMLLGHRQLSTTERYTHGYGSDGARLASAMGDVIAGAWNRPAVAAPVLH